MLSTNIQRKYSGQPHAIHKYTKEIYTNAWKGVAGCDQPEVNQSISQGTCFTARWVLANLRQASSCKILHKPQWDCFKSCFHLPHPTNLTDMNAGISASLFVTKLHCVTPKITIELLLYYCVTPKITIELLLYYSRHLRH